MRWWEVSRRHGVPMVSHDGSGFDSHANVVLGYTCAWHRMTKLAVVRRSTQLAAAVRVTASGSAIGMC